MVTAAAVAHANRLPVLLLAGDTFQPRIPDPVLQQVEHFDEPSVTVNDAFRPVTRYWDRITRPAQVATSLPQRVATMLDPAECGPAFLALPQDVQAEAYDYPVRLFEPRVHEMRRPRPDRARARRGRRGAARRRAAADRGRRRRALLARRAGAARFAEAHGVPVVETMAGKSSVVADHPLYAGPDRRHRRAAANALAAEADVVLAVGTRLQDFTTGSWTVFANEDLRIIGINASRFDAAKHRSLPLVCDAREGLPELAAALGGWSAPRCVARAVAHGVRGVSRARARGRRAPPGCHRAVVRAGHRRRQLDARARRLRRLVRGRFPGRAQRQLALARAWRRSTASTASRAWATRSRARGARAWRGSEARFSRSSATART